MSFASSGRFFSDGLRDHEHKWHFLHAEPSRQPPLRPLYLHASAHPNGCPALPRDELSDNISPFCSVGSINSGIELKLNSKDCEPNVSASETPSEENEQRGVPALVDSEEVLSALCIASILLVFRKS
mmetsp:Transcript_1887/g.3760  ORF Transcript_1887/g.3760 Transcript_1887/m.3760 type:complete len:127 (+) Transcript_1887:497-877(+)